MDDHTKNWGKPRWVIEFRLSAAHLAADSVGYYVFDADLPEYADRDNRVFGPFEAIEDATVCLKSQRDSWEATKHTPGPWIFCGDHVDDAQGKPLIRSEVDFNQLNPLNMRLIAAAPDLLEACKAVLPWVAVAAPSIRDGDDAHPQAVANHAEDLALLQAAIAAAERK